MTNKKGGNKRIVVSGELIAKSNMPGVYRLASGRNRAVLEATVKIMMSAQGLISPRSALAALDYDLSSEPSPFKKFEIEVDAGTYRDICAIGVELSTDGLVMSPDNVIKYLVNKYKTQISLAGRNSSIITDGGRRKINEGH